MAPENQTVSPEEFVRISHQCTALHQDWQHFYTLAAAPPDTEASERQLQYIQLQSRLSCDYPILSHWRNGNFGLASSIGKLVANVGTLESFAAEARNGSGPLVDEWKDVNESIVRVCQHLNHVHDQMKAGKPVRLPKEISLPKKREPLPYDKIGEVFRKACIVLVCCIVLFFLLRPVFIHTGLLTWLDEAYVQWQLRDGLDATVLQPTNK